MMFFKYNEHNVNMTTPAKATAEADGMLLARKYLVLNQSAGSPSWMKITKVDEFKHISIWN